MSAMNEDKGGAAPWEAFWRRTRESGALAGRGQEDEILVRYWSGFLNEACSRGRRRLIDLACGSGAVAALAMRHSPAPDVVAVDLSIAAVHALRRRVPGVAAVACDARRTPFADGSFDVATSQFGIEYAGAAAMSEVARLVAPGGLFAAVMHFRGGAMYRENVANLEAARAINASGLLPGLKALFHADAQVGRGAGSREVVRQAEAALQAALSQLDAMLARLGPAVAGGMAWRLRTDADHMRQRIRFHDAAEVMRWTDLMAQELGAYEGRMAAMLDAANDAQGMDALAAPLQHRGFSVRLRESTPLGRASGEPAAWLFIAERG